jgi:ribose transport system permease protein
MEMKQADAETTTDRIEGGDKATGAKRAPRRHRALRPSHLTGVFIWAAFIAVFAIWVPDTFLTSLTAQTILSEQAVTAIVAIGLLAPLAAGVFDLSVGSMVGLSAMMISSLTANSGLPLVPAVVLTLAIGATVGAINGFLIVGVRINSFIATLAMSSVLLAPAHAVSGETIVSGLPSSLTGLTEGRVAGIPVIAFYMAAIGLIVWYLLEHTPTGRRITATGSGPEAARLAGVRTGRLIFGSLVMSALLATVAGILLASKLRTATPELGPAYLLPAFAAAFLGTTQVKPGRFNVLGTMVAIFLLATGVKGLQLAGAPDWVNDLFNGVALIIAVSLSLWGSRLTELFKRGRNSRSDPGPRLAR